MQIFRDMDDVSQEFQNAVVTIGNFDGVHVGHQHIMTRLLGEARKRNQKAVVITFEPHPKMILHPDIQPFYLITTLEEKMDLLEKLGIDAVVLLHFTKEFAKITAEAFVYDMLWGKLKVNKIFIGHNYAFGNDKKGNDAYLTEVGEKLGFDVEVISAVMINDLVISSTCTRDAILAGDVKKVAAILGRPFNVRGIVVPGHRRGAGLGFPTANIKPEKALIPPYGVYAVRTVIDGQTYLGVLNIGENPTFADKELSIELHILDFEGDIYNRQVNVLFFDRIRGEVKFNSPDALVAQIRQDVSRTREILSI